MGIGAMAGPCGIKMSTPPSGLAFDSQVPLVEAREDFGERRCASAQKRAGYQQGSPSISPLE